jgi:hypothetical protein
MFEKTKTFVKKYRPVLAIGGATLVAVGWGLVSYRAGKATGRARVLDSINGCLAEGSLVWGDGHKIESSSEYAKLAAEAVKKVAEENLGLLEEIFPTRNRITVG